MSKYIILYGLGLVSLAIIFFVSTRLILGIVKKKYFAKKVEEKEEAKEEVKQEQTQAQEELKKEEPTEDEIKKEMF